MSTRDWVKTTFGEICTITRGASPRPIMDWVSSAGTPWVKISDATGEPGRFISQTKEFIKNEGRSKSVVVYPGDLVVSNSATPGLPKFLRIEACVHDGWLLLRNFKGALPEFLYYVVLNDRKTLVGKGSGSVFTNLKTEILKNHEIALPEIPEQKRISDTLGQLDDLIALNVAVSKTLEDLAQTIFKSWFVDFDPVKAKMAGEKPAGMDDATAALFPDSMEESELGLIPKGWEARQLKSALVLHKSTIKAGTATESVPYVPIDQIGSRDIFLKNSMSGSEAKTSLVSFEKNEILFGAMRPYFHKVALAPFDGTTRTTTFVLRAINPRYLAFSLLTVFQDSAVAYATNHSQGTTIPYAVWNNSFENYPLVFPSESVATAFNDLVLPLIEYGYSLVKENQKLVQLRNGLLPRLISGELQIPDEMLAS